MPEGKTSIKGRSLSSKIVSRFWRVPTRANVKRVWLQKVKIKLIRASLLIVRRSGLLELIKRLDNIRWVRMVFLRLGIMGPQCGFSCLSALSFDSIYEDEDPYKVLSNEDYPRVKASVEFAKFILNSVNITHKSKKFLLLDVGCGEGIITHEISQSLSCFSAICIGVDIPKKALVRARHNTSITDFVCAHMEYLPFKDDTISVVTCFESIYYAQDYLKAIREFYRVLTKGGICILSTHSTFPQYLPPKKLIPNVKEVFSEKVLVIKRYHWSMVNDRTFMAFRKGGVLS